MKQILLIRHGSTAGNLEQRYIGRTDEPLCALGVAQAQALSRMAFTVDKLYVSPAKRAVQTAQIAFPNVPYTVVPALWETDFGMFEGKNAAELRDDPHYRAWVEANCQTAIPGGESVEQFKKRCCHAFAQITKRLPEDCRAGFVIHGGCIMAILEAFAAPQKDFYDYHIKNGSHILCTYQDGRLTVSNDADAGKTTEPQEK